jgi:hypothetical protein
VTPDAFTRDTFSIAFYDSVIVFEKGQVRQKESLEIGGRRRAAF